MRCGEVVYSIDEDPRIEFFQLSIISYNGEAITWCSDPAVAFLLALPTSAFQTRRDLWRRQLKAILATVAVSAIRDLFTVFHHLDLQLLHSQGETCEMS